MKTIICFVLVVILTAKRNKAQEGENFCEDKVHYNSLTITCCAMKKYESPTGMDPFVNDGEIKKCLAKDEIKSENLSKKLWGLYKCLLETKIQGGITLNSFTEFMMKRFDNPVKEKIKASIDRIKKELPKKYQRRRRRDADEATTLPTDSTDDSTNGEDGTNAPNAPQQDSTDQTTQPENDNAAGDKKNEQTTQAPNEQNNVVETTVAPQEPENEEKKDSDSGNSASDNKPNPGDQTTAKSWTLYAHLSVFEYFEKFKDAIPDADIVRIWDVYYTAEFEACHRLANKNDADMNWYYSPRCLSWIQRTARRGECCNDAPVPFPLLPEPSFEVEQVQNYTAKNLMSLAGEYTYTNYTYSSNIMRCRRLALAVMQNHVNLEDLKTEVNKFFENNGTIPKDYNYKAVAKKLIPHFYSEAQKSAIEAEILPDKDPGEPGNPNKDQYYKVLQRDSDIQRIKNLNNSEFKWASPHEWDKLETNKARYLMWSCDAYRMISQRIKYFDITPFCYQA